LKQVCLMVFYSASLQTNMIGATHRVTSAWLGLRTLSARADLLEYSPEPCSSQHALCLLVTTACHRAPAYALGVSEPNHQKRNMDTSTQTCTCVCM
jgi:hypothetical protein